MLQHATYFEDDCGGIDEQRRPARVGGERHKNLALVDTLFMCVVQYLDPSASDTGRLIRLPPTYSKPSGSCKSRRAPPMQWAAIRSTSPANQSSPIGDIGALLVILLDRAISMYSARRSPGAVSISAGSGTRVVMGRAWRINSLSFAYAHSMSIGYPYSASSLHIMALN